VYGEEGMESGIQREREREREREERDGKTKPGRKQHAVKGTCWRCVDGCVSVTPEARVEGLKMVNSFKRDITSPCTDYSRRVYHLNASSPHAKIQSPELTRRAKNIS
jgi:hypothetical protein